MKTYKLIDKVTGRKVGTVRSDCFENADYRAQSRGWVVWDYVGANTLLVTR